MLARLRADLEPDDVLLFSAVAEGSVLHEMLSPDAAQADGFESVQHGPFYPHRTARVTDDYEAYLKLLGSRTRADLRATRKKFLAQARSSVRTRRYTSPAEIEEFVRDAMTVSRTTWQFRHLKAGLRDADTLTRQYRAMAALGWFRSYVVYVGEQPVAFQVGHVFRDVYHAHDTGYDPQWAHLSAGNFQHTEIMLDLADDGVIRVFDFDRGDFAHKQRLATDTMPLGYFHLIPATPGGRFLAAALRTAEMCRSRSAHGSNGSGSAPGRNGYRARDLPGGPDGDFRSARAFTSQAMGAQGDAVDAHARRAGRPADDRPHAVARRVGAHTGPRLHRRYVVRKHGAARCVFAAAVEHGDGRG